MASRSCKFASGSRTAPASAARTREQELRDRLIRRLHSPPRHCPAEHSIPVRLQVAIDDPVLVAVRVKVLEGRAGSRAVSIETRAVHHSRPLT